MTTSRLRYLSDIRTESLETVLAHLLTEAAPPGDFTEYYSTIARIYDDADAVADLLFMIGLLEYPDGPTGHWRSLAAMPSAWRCEQLQYEFESVFQAAGGTSVAAAMRERPKRQDRIRWFADKHGLNPKTTAAYAERIYRTAQEYLKEQAESRRLPA